MSYISRIATPDQEAWLGHCSLQLRNNDWYRFLNTKTLLPRKISNLELVHPSLNFVHLSLMPDMLSLHNPFVSSLLYLRRAQKLLVLLMLVLGLF